MGVVLSLLLLYVVASMCFRRKLVLNPTRHKLSRDQIKALAAQRINKFGKEDTTKSGIPEKSEKSN